MQHSSWEVRHDGQQLSLQMYHPMEGGLWSCRPPMLDARGGFVQSFGISCLMVCMPHHTSDMHTLSSDWAQNPSKSSMQPSNTGSDLSAAWLQHPYMVHAHTATHRASPAKAAAIIIAMSVPHGRTADTDFLCTAWTAAAPKASTVNTPAASRSSLHSGSLSHLLP